MLFNSYGFLFGFLPIVLVGFYLAASINRAWAAGWLGLASLLFYGWWSWAALPLLVASICINFGFGRLIVGAQGDARRRLLLTLGVGANLAVLGYFKYANFLLDTTRTVGGLGGDGKLLAIVLPIGISFYTFTQIAFLVDCRQGKVGEARFVHYLLFVSYFPHLIFTFLAVCLAWVFFRASNFHDAIAIQKGLVGLNGIGWDAGPSRGWGSIALALGLSLWPWNSNAVADRIERWRVGRAGFALAAGMALGCLLAFATLRISGNDLPRFLYFQF